MEEYELNGTLEDIQNILQQDFDMSQHEARFLIYNLLNQNPTPNIDKEEINEWYLNPEEKYTGRVFNTHYSINLTNVKIELCHKACTFLCAFFFSKEFNIAQFGAELLYVICTAIQRVKDEDYCVFARIIELNVGNKGKLFSSDQIVTANKDHKCDFQSEHWQCPYLQNDDECTNSFEKIQLSLMQLEKQNVITKMGNCWVLN
jgi:hypothetical protein